MLKAIITYLNLKLELLNYFDLTRCLVELKESETDNGTLKQPVEYISNGEFDVINFDEFNGVSYWRLRDEPSTDRTETQKYRAGAKNNIETTIPLRLVFAVPRTKLTEDDAYSFDRIRQTMVKQFAIDDEVLKNQLGAISVRITQVGSNSKAKDVWEEETEGTGTFEPKYETVFGSIDVDVVIVSDHECLPTECDDVESDIIRAFDWCGNTAVTVGRLTQDQQDCISAYICGVADPVQIQINGTDFTTAASGTTYNQEIENSAGTPVGTVANPSVVGDSSIGINGVNFVDLAAEANLNIPVHDTDDNDVGTINGSEIEIADSTITINGSSLGATGSVLAEDSLDIDVTQSGSPIGSWNGSEWVIPAAATCPSVSLAVSDTTPEFGDTVTMTATATDFQSGDDLTYHFIVRDNVGNWQKVEQTNDNTYDWDVPYAGTYMVHVIVDDESGGSASDCVEITAGTLQDKYSFDATYLFQDSTLVDGRVDDVTDDTGNGYDGSAPSSTDRPIYYSDPLVSASGSARCIQGSSQRLNTSLSILQSELTFCAVFYITNNGLTLTPSAQFLFGGAATEIFGGRYNARMLNTSPYLFLFGTLNSAETGGTSVSGNAQVGRNVVVGKFDGTNFRLNLNGSISTATLSGGLSTTATNFMLLNAGSDNPTYHNKAPMVNNVSEIRFKTTALSDADQDQLYADLLLKYPNG